MLRNRLKSLKIPQNRPKSLKITLYHQKSSKNHQKIIKKSSKNHQKSPENDTRWGKWLAKNINFFDLGYSNELTDQSEIDFAIDEIMKQFDFIMISDYMEESLILLKEELCLQISDIVFFSINKR